MKASHPVLRWEGASRDTDACGFLRRPTIVSVITSPGSQKDTAESAVCVPCPALSSSKLMLHDRRARTPRETARLCDRTTTATTMPTISRFASAAFEEQPFFL